MEKATDKLGFGQEDQNLSLDMLILRHLVDTQVEILSRRNIWQELYFEGLLAYIWYLKT